MNITPDSFLASSRVDDGNISDRAEQMLSRGAVILDIGAVSTRPGATEVGLEEEWSRLESCLKALKNHFGADLPRISIDTVRAEIVRRCCGLWGSVIVNDISAGEDDPDMLPLVSELGLRYVAMHKRGTPQTMDNLCDYSACATPEFPSGVVPAIVSYFREFALRAEAAGVHDWILDPGLGFAKTPDQCWEILENLEEFKVFGRPLLIGASDKRFTKTLHGKSISSRIGEDRVWELALAADVDYLRVHM